MAIVATVEATSYDEAVELVVEEIEAAKTGDLRNFENVRVETDYGHDSDGQRVLYLPSENEDEMSLDEDATDDEDVDECDDDLP